VHVRKDAYTLYIGRGRGSKGTSWGNPYRIGDPHPETGKPMTREDAVRLHMEWMVRSPEGRRLLPRIVELEGHVLGCFCAPEGGLTEHDSPYVCHGQNLLRLLSHARKKLEAKRRAGAARGAARGAGGPETHYYRVVRESHRSFRTNDFTEETVASGLSEAEAAARARTANEEARAAGALAHHRPSVRGRKGGTPWASR
jgi:hypothetical protein